MINLHHFLYLQALVLKPQKGPPSLTLTKADGEQLERLSSGERDSWNTAVSYYRNFLVKHDLLLDDELIMTKDRLEDAETSLDLAKAQIPIELRTVLLKAAPVYRKHWWQAHDAANREWIAHLMPLGSQYGTTLSMRLESIYAQPWPQYPVRVDAVTYANWAGAYTTLHPTRPTISTTDPANQGPAALEMLFHETSHGMVDKLRNAISVAEASLNSRQPSNVFHSGSIWHAVLFYTAGELVREQIPGYIPYAEKNGLWYGRGLIPTGL